MQDGVSGGPGLHTPARHAAPVHLHSTHVTTALGFFSTAYTLSFRSACLAARSEALTRGPRPAPSTIKTLESEYKSTLWLHYSTCERTWGFNISSCGKLTERLCPSAPPVRGQADIYTRPVETIIDIYTQPVKTITEMYTWPVKTITDIYTQLVETIPDINKWPVKTTTDIQPHTAHQSF